MFVVAGVAGVGIEAGGRVLTMDGVRASTLAVIGVALMVVGAVGVTRIGAGAGAAEAIDAISPPFLFFVGRAPVLLVAAEATDACGGKSGRF